jgi:hypothetical protein
VHNQGPTVGILTLYADGRIGKVMVPPNDPQPRFHQSLWRLEASLMPRRAPLPPGAPRVRRP